MSAVITPDRIPEALRKIPNWHQWQPEIRDGKWTKVPKVAGESRNASSTDPATWTKFMNAVAKLNGDGRGLGFTLTEPDGLVFIDLDGCVNLETGAIAPWARAIVSRLDSYAERSPNDGVHIWIRGKLPATGNKVGAVEMYSSGRYATVTGNRIETCPETIRDADVSWLHRLMVARVFDFEKNSKLATLMSGNTSGYASPSEADLALCSLLAQLGLNQESIADAVSISGLWDAKWERDDYRQRTIEKALSQPQRSASVELLRSENGNPRAVVENVLTLLRQSPEWSGCTAYNEFTNRTVMRKPGPGFPLPPDQQEFPREWTDRDTVNATAWMQRQGILIQSMDAVGRAVQTVARENPFHPVRDFLRSLTWDGTLRITTWLPAYLGAPDTPYTRTVGPCWLVSAVARIMIPGVQADATILLQGAQGIGKSSALRVLASDSWFSDHLSQLATKDSRLELQGRWIVEISELSAMRRSEIETVKAYLTQRFDSFRAPYARTTETIARQNIFAATSNAEAVLTDESGSRRFWPVTCGRIQVRELEKKRDQLWAEAYAAFLRKQPWWLTPEQEAALARPEQEQRYESGCWDDLIARWIDRLGDARSEVRRVKEFESNPLPWFGSTAGKVSVTDVIIHAVGRDVPGKGDEMTVSRYLRHAGWKRKRETAGPFRNRYFYYRPEGGKND